TEGVAHLLKKNKVATFQGTARLAGRAGEDGHRVQVKGPGGEETLVARAGLLATGSEPISLPSPAFDGPPIVSSAEALAFDRVPQHLIVVGGGYIGLELGSVWSRLGAKVTVVEFLPRILPLGDAEVSQQLHRSLSKQGLTFHLETKVTGAGRAGG